MLAALWIVFKENKRIKGLFIQPRMSMNNTSVQNHMNLTENSLDEDEYRKILEFSGGYDV